MKIKLTQAGYENFTGVFGNHTFQDGLSEDLSPESFAALGATIQCEDQSEPAQPESGTPPAPAVPVQDEGATEVAEIVTETADVAGDETPSEVAEVSPEATPEV